jgi:hypothetical protein
LNGTCSFINLSQKKFDMALLNTNILEEIKPFFQHCTNHKFKRIHDCLIALELTNLDTITPETNEDRVVADSRFAKYRTQFAYVTCIFDIRKKEYVFSVLNLPRCVRYQVNHWMLADGFEPNHDIVCGSGIHYFNTLEAAFFYVELEHPVYQEQTEVTFGENGHLVSVRENGVWLVKKIDSEVELKIVERVLAKYKLEHVVFHPSLKKK